MESATKGLIFKLLIILEIISWLINGLIWSYSSNNRVHDFDTFEEDLQVIAELAYKEYDKNLNEYPMIDVVYYKIPSPYLYECNNEKEIKMTRKEKDSLKNIWDNAFRHKEQGQLDIIRVYKNHVTFSIANGVYALVYSVNGRRPNFAHDLAENKQTKIVRINKHWYHVLRRN